LTEKEDELTQVGLKKMRFLAVVVVQSVFEIIVYVSLSFSAQPAAPVNY